MAYLLDSHILFWVLADTKQLSEPVVNIIEDKNIEILVSQVTLMELTIKMNIGKLTYGTGVKELLTDISALGLRTITVENQDLEMYSGLPLHHRDPFDRFIIAQAQSRSLTIITSDPMFKQYQVGLLIN